MEIPIENIIVPKGRRPLDQAKVAEIAESFKLVGQIAPIGLRRAGNASAETSFERVRKLELVFGEHRLEAAKTVGWEKIDAVEIHQIVLTPNCQEGYDDYTKLVEITENLHRAELTTQQRNEQLAAWVELYNRNAPQRNSDAEQPNSKPGPKPDPGVAAAARMTGRTPKNIKEAIKTTKVSPAVKAAADAAELTSKQRLAISRLPEAEQLDAVHAAVSAQANRAADKPEKPDVSAPADRAEQQTTLAHNEPAKLTPNIDASRAAYLADVQALDLTFEQKATEIHKIMEATGLWLRHGTFRPRMVS
jgi:ParB-like chromosome segregation protein Spo0J